jgi:transposase InsO family protein
LQESYGYHQFDNAQQAEALATLARAGCRPSRPADAVVSARVTAPTSASGSSWLSHRGAAGWCGTPPADHDLLLASQWPTLRHLRATVPHRGLMPGLKRPWLEGAYYGFDCLADDAGIGYAGMDFGYWRIP